MTEDERVSYGRAVWSEVVRRRGYDWPEMDSVDYHLLSQWMDQGIPLRIVLRGLEETKKPGRVLRYYEGPVRKSIEFWRKALNA